MGTATPPAPALALALALALSACGATTTFFRGDGDTDGSVPWDGNPGDTALPIDLYPPTDRPVYPPDCIDCGRDVPGDVDAGMAPTCGRPLIACFQGGAWQCRNLQSDPANCGSCGWTCRGGCPCELGVCTPIECGPGRGDCNGLCTDGCEVDLVNDPAHCGACNRRCATGQVCVEASCRTVRDAGFDTGRDTGIDTGRDSGRDTGIDTYVPFCAGQNVCQTGSCTTPRVLGIFWNGLECVALMGCRCIGLDCSIAYSSLAACESVRVGCPRRDAGAPLMSCSATVSCPFGATCVPVGGGSSERRCVSVFEPYC